MSDWLIATGINNHPDFHLDPGRNRSSNIDSSLGHNKIHKMDRRIDPKEEKKSKCSVKN